MKRYEDIPMTREQLENAGRLVRATLGKMPYRTIDKGQYEIYCPFCDTYKKIDYKELRSIQHTQNCPTCGYHYYRSATTKELEHRFNTYVNIDNLGYHIIAKWKFGEEPKIIDYQLMLERLTDYTYHVKKGYKLNTSGYLYRDRCVEKEQWTQKYNYKFGWNFYPYYCEWLAIYGSEQERRKALERLIDAPLKSSQIQLIRNNRVNLAEINAIVVFDINHIEDLTPHKAYILENESHLKDFIHHNITLNKYYLEYLDRNEINLGDYYHYMNNLKMLGFKLDKPTDFNYRNTKVENMVQDAKDKSINANIIERYNSLPEYEKDNISITPFKSAGEIRNCGKKLHNCIGGYVSRYSENRTNLFHLDVDDELKIAIEVCDKRLQQAYADHNSKCPDNLMKYIIDFCNLNNYSLGRYAEMQA